MVSVARGAPGEGDAMRKMRTMNECFHQRAGERGDQKWTRQVGHRGVRRTAQFHEITKRDKCATIERRLVTFLVCGLER